MSGRNTVGVLLAIALVSGPYMASPASALECGLIPVCAGADTNGGTAVHCNVNYAWGYATASPDDSFGVDTTVIPILLTQEETRGQSSETETSTGGGLGAAKAWAGDSSASCALTSLWPGNLSDPTQPVDETIEWLEKMKNDLLHLIGGSSSPLGASDPPLDIPTVGCQVPGSVSTEARFSGHLYLGPSGADWWWEGQRNSGDTAETLLIPDDDGVIFRAEDRGTDDREGIRTPLILNATFDTDDGGGGHCHVTLEIHPRCDNPSGTASCIGLAGKS